MNQSVPAPFTAELFNAEAGNLPVSSIIYQTVNLKPKSFPRRRRSDLGAMKIPLLKDTNTKASPGDPNRNP